MTLSSSGLAAAMNRRQFLARLSAAALVLRGHGAGALSAGTTATEPHTLDAKLGEPSSGAARIQALRLLTACPLDEMARFYGRDLGLPVRSVSSESLVVGAGATEITFVHTAEPDLFPFYHFAFNIPENKILSARSWQLERSPLFLTPDNLRDPQFPEDVRHFRSWNAHSVFFWDPAGNVVEYIARHDLDNPAEGPFTSRDILYASEIAFVVEDVPGAASRLETTLSLPQYQSASEVFHATGDETGLLLLFKRGRTIGDTLRNRPAPAEAFSTRATIRGLEVGNYAFPDAPFEIEISGSNVGRRA